MDCSFRTLFAAAVVSFLISSCGGSSPELMGGEFSSLQQCLSAIQTKTGLSLKPVIDKPDHVSGYLGNTKRDFSCKQMSTGTKGVYWEGWYEDE
jgi:hypothetical protein